MAEYGFGCTRVSDDWRGADSWAYRKDTDEILMVQLKTCLIIDKWYLDAKNLYIGFPMDGTGNWYLIKHDRLMDIVQEHAPHWFESKRWDRNGSYWSYRTNRAMREALEEYAYGSEYGDLGYREASSRFSKEAVPGSG